MNRDALYPYLVRGPVGSEWKALCLPVGHGLFAQLFEDASTAIVPVSAEQLREANLTAEEAHRIALDNLVRFADDSPGLSIQVLGNPGDPIHFLLYSDHPRASACLRLPDLYEHAIEVLQEKELCACVPQRDSLVIFPKRDRAYRGMLVAKLHRIEADASFPLGFELFELAPGEVNPFIESDSK